MQQKVTYPIQSAAVAPNQTANKGLALIILHSYA